MLTLNALNADEAVLAFMAMMEARIGGGGVLWGKSVVLADRGIEVEIAVSLCEIVRLWNDLNVLWQNPIIARINKGMQTELELQVGQAATSP